MFASLLNAHDHGVGTDKMFYPGFAEACFLHPLHAVAPGVVEAAGGLDQHIQAHQQAKGVARAIIVNDALIDNVGARPAAMRQRLWRSAFAWSPDPSRAGCDPS